MRCAALVLTLFSAACSSGLSTMNSRATPAGGLAAPDLQADVHSFANPAEARTTHIELDWEVDFQRREIRGSAALDLALAPGAAQCVLDTRDLAIEAVADGAGRPLSFALDPRDRLLGSALRIELPPGT